MYNISCHIDNFKTYVRLFHLISVYSPGGTGGKVTGGVGLFVLLTGGTAVDNGGTLVAGLSVGNGGVPGSSVGTGGVSVPSVGIGGVTGSSVGIGGVIGPSVGIGGIIVVGTTVHFRTFFFITFFVEHFPQLFLQLIFM